MRWLASPTRRELTLLIFCLTVFTLAYNLENTLRFVGFDVYGTRGAILTRFGFTPTNTIVGTLQKDGRKLEEWRDELDNLIIWNGEVNNMYSEWKDSDVKYGTIEAGQPLGVGPHSAMWISKARLEQLWPSKLAAKSIKEGFWRWNDDVPRTKLVRHSPGYTVLDQPIILNNVIYIVTDDPQSFPELSSITRTLADQLQVVSTQQARVILGKYGGMIHGVSWMCAEPVPQDTTLLSLWSIYSTLSNLSSADPSSFSKSSSPLLLPDLLSPARLILPSTPTFADPDNYEDGNKKPNFPFNYAEQDILPPSAPPRPPVLPRHRSYTGIHPLLLKIALPHTPGVWYKEEWDDYMGMEVPYVLESVVLGDYGVDGIEALLQQRSQGSRDWWEPIRRNVVSFFQYSGVLTQDDNSWKKSLTYAHRPNSVVSEDHNALVRALMKMGREKGIEVNLVDAGTFDGHDSEKVNPDDVEWGTRMGAIVRSDLSFPFCSVSDFLGQILLASQGSDILDGVFLRPSSPASTSIMVEFFAPPAVAPNEGREGDSVEIPFAGAREHGTVAKSLGLRYVPWVKDR
ncbi:hypothetical protein J3R30DRAFT_759933 [Lentinula aciculospora]|uniref:Uncharacterized protein n=1 Tax=Lentinula aciculospora TaxID=153920 RepID=A0A9W9DJ85_9AGAR|nr:hypothetical protein J3R30DRAFT_759933 [Lentinula aciculospora]